jgi:hypothetical protein
MTHNQDAPPIETTTELPSGDMTVFPASGGGVLIIARNDDGRVQVRACAPDWSTQSMITRSVSANGTTWDRAYHGLGIR